MSGLASLYDYEVRGAMVCTYHVSVQWQGVTSYHTQNSVVFITHELGIGMYFC